MSKSDSPDDAKRDEVLKKMLQTKPRPHKKPDKEPVRKNDPSRNNKPPRSEKL